MNTGNFVECDKNGGNKSNIYELINVLVKCEIVSMQCQLVSQEILEIYQRKCIESNKHRESIENSSQVQQ